MKQTKEKPASTAKSETGFPVIKFSLPVKTVVYAKDYKCVRCRRVNQMAVTFVGLNDPDGTRYPMCRKHADAWRMEVLFGFSGIRKVYKKRRKKKWWK